MGPLPTSPTRGRVTSLARPLLIMRLALVLALTCCCLAAATLTCSGSSRPAPIVTSSPAKSPRDPVIVAVGDIACDERPGVTDPDKRGGGCHESSTFTVARSLNPIAVLALGDEQYPAATYDQFMGSYDKTWGTLKGITHPAVGNHEYETPLASGYFKYFGSAAGAQAKGYYSFNLAGWHFIAINANCWAIGGCEKGSPQERWLAADLAAHPAACTLAYWHQPRFSSGGHHSDKTYQALWDDLYAARADIVLNGHDHDYERFGPQTPSGAGDGRNGIREFVVGIGGKSHYPFLLTEPNSQVRNDDTFGVLALTLHARGYDWRFVSEAGGRFSDNGSGSCHGRSSAAGGSGG